MIRSKFILGSTIRSQLRRGLVLCLAALVALTALGLSGSYYVYKRQQAITNLRALENHALELQALLPDIMLDLRQAVVAPDRVVTARLMAEAENLYYLFDTFRHVARDLSLAEDLSFADRVEPEVLVLRTNIVNCVQRAHAGESDAALAMLTDVITPRMVPVRHFISDVTYAKQYQIDAEQATLQRVARAFAIAGVALSCILLFILTTVLRHIHDIITERLDRLIRATYRVRDGDFGIRMRASGTDELAQLSRHFDEMVEELGRHRAQLEDTNRKLKAAMEAAQASSQAKSQFLANMSHELRTPLTAILGFAEIIAEDDQASAAQQLEAARTIQRNGQHLLTIINDILDLAKIEAGKLGVEPQAFDVRTILPDTLAVVQNVTRTKGLELVCTAAGPVPSTLRSDPTRVRQILVNLLANASKFTESGSIQMRLSVDGAPPTARLCFDVIDSGSGIPDDIRGRLFEPFTQADISNSRKHGGTGLGLTISRRLARALGGDLELAWTSGDGGTCFRFSLPVDSRDTHTWIEDLHLNTAQVPMPESMSDTPLTDRRILVAEDGPDNQRLIAHILRRAGATVDIAPDGRLAVAAVEQSDAHFDAVLMDMQMPEMDGYEATNALRKRGYKGPIIALTAHAMRGDRERCLRVGCTNYASKPVNRRKLIALIEQHLTPTEQPTS